MRKTTVLLAAAGALFLVGCRAEVNINLDIEEDGSGVVAFELGFDQEFRDLMASNGADPDNLFGDLEETGLGEAEGEAFEREEGEMSFQGVRLEFDNVDEIAGALEDSSGDFGGFNTFSLELDDTSAVFDATISAPEQNLDDIPFDPSQFAGDVFSANFILTMPGTVISHNADEVLADGRLRWDLPLLGGEANFHAESSFGSGGFPWLPVIIGIALLVGLIAMIIAVYLGKQQEKRAVSDAAAAYPEQAPIPPKQSPSDDDSDSSDGD